MIDWGECFIVCTDGAPSMMGCRKSLVVHVKKVNPSVQVIQHAAPTRVVFFIWTSAPTAIISFRKQVAVTRQSFSSCYKIAELETFCGRNISRLAKNFRMTNGFLLLFYWCDMMKALNTLNKSMQRECHTAQTKYVLLEKS